MNLPRTILSTIGTMITGALVAIAPMLFILWMLIIIDFITARRLGRRLVRSGAITPDRARLSSQRLGRLVGTLSRTFVTLLLSAMADTAIFSFHGYATLPFVATFLVLWQTISILENEAASNPASWAALARRILIDKTRRHLDKP
ncbi:MAG: phage holin family protein [Muribaculaceae bacterium]|nr:phage holin family protein [Muribaculaceae bacterium]